MKKRIKELRKSLGLTQQQFADRIGISRGNVATYETRDGSPGSSVVNLICREFNVSEKWLRTGEGEMFVTLTRDEEVASFVGDLLADGDSFKLRMISVLAQLDESEWKVIEKMALKLAFEEIAKHQEEQKKTPIPVSEDEQDDLSKEALKLFQSLDPGQKQQYLDLMRGTTNTEKP